MDYFKNAMFKHSTSKQSGQAMVEYAILLVLMVTLIMGGLELSVTAYNSKKTGDAAEAGANAWAEAISHPNQKSNLSELEHQIQLELLRQTLLVDTNNNLAVRNNNGVSTTIPADGNCTVFPSDTCPAEALAEEIRPRLGNAGNCKFDHDANIATPTVFFDPRYIDPNGLDTTYVPTYAFDMPIDITSCDSNDADFIVGFRALLLAFGLDYSNSDPLLDYYEVCTSEQNSDQIEKVITCREILDVTEDDNGNNILDTGEDSNNNGTLDNVSNGIDEADRSFKRLLISKTDNNGNPRSLVIDKNLNTNLGNHDAKRVDTVSNGISNQFRRAGCNVVVEGVNLAYDNGLPQDGSIYLFNPLPIDITDCNGEDATRNNTSRTSILVGGFTNNANAALNIEGLPALNQAMYSQYTRVCVNLAGDLNNPRITIVSCNNFTTDALNRIWLKPPGKMCGARFGGEVCPDLEDVEGDGDLVISNFKGATGFYFFGHANDAEKGSFQWLNAETPTNADIFGTFRPAFQIVCDGSVRRHQDVNTDSLNATNQGACLANGTGSFALEVNTRYRSVFESFLTFGIRELVNADLAAYFYNPNGVGNGSVLVGATGSELGPIGKNGRPSIKQFKDFRGCFRVDISPPDKIGEQVKTAVSSCN